MDPITRLCAFILCFGIYLSFSYFLYWICETWDKYSKRKTQRKIKTRRDAFARSVERAGRALRREDNKREAVSYPKKEKKKPIRKAVGYFSDDLAQLLVK